MRRHLIIPPSQCAGIIPSFRKCTNLNCCYFGLFGHCCPKHQAHQRSRPILIAPIESAARITCRVPVQSPPLNVGLRVLWQISQYVACDAWLKRLPHLPRKDRAAARKRMLTEAAAGTETRAREEEVCVPRGEVLGRKQVYLFVYFALTGVQTAKCAKPECPQTCMPSN
jgi:hypothetical protein